MLKYIFNVLEKKLKCILAVPIDNHKVLHALGPRTKYFEQFLIFNKTKLLFEFWPFDFFKNLNSCSHILIKLKKL